MSKRSVAAIIAAIDKAPGLHLYEVRLLPDHTVMFITSPPANTDGVALDVDDWLSKNGTG